MESTPTRLLSALPDEAFQGRRREIERIYQLAVESAGARRHSTLLVGRRGIGKSEILRHAYNRLFWNQRRVVPICLSLTRETTDLVAFCKQWLATFIRQFIGFQRRDAALINDEAMPYASAVRMAHEMSDPWLGQLINNFEDSLADEDWVSLLRNSIAAPLLTARNRNIPLYTMVDEFQRIGFLDVGDKQVSLAGQFDYILQSGEAPHLLAGSSLRVIERLLGSNLLGRHIERLRIEPLSSRPALRLWERVCREVEIECDRTLGLEIVEQLEGIPLYIQAVARAVARQGVKLTSQRNFQMVYAQDLLSGEIGAVWNALFEETIPEVGLRRDALRVMARVAQSDTLAPVPWNHLSRAVGLEEDVLQSVVERLERAGFLEVGHSQVYPIADRVLRDWLQMSHGRLQTNDGGVLRQGLVRERLLWSATMRQDRAQRQIGERVEIAMNQWDCQTIPSILFAWSDFHYEYAGQLFQSVSDQIESQTETVTLPQIVGLSTISAGIDAMPLLIGYGFEARRYEPGAETVIIAQVHREQESVNATDAEHFLAESRMQAERLGVVNVHPWLIARGGFTEEAIEVLHEGGAWSSDFTQLQLLLRHFGVKTEHDVPAAGMTLTGSETLLAGEYALAIPMESDTELVAASAIEQIAAQAGFPEAARGQIKMAVIEACINAREYASDGSAISLTIRPSDTSLEIVVDNPGQGFDADDVAEPVLEDKIGSSDMRSKRGWGLKLMRNLMDEVIFETTDEGTRVRLIKMRPAAAQSPSPPVLDITQE